MKHIVWFVLLLCQAGLPAIQAQVLSNESMSFGGDTRTYLKYIPEGYDEGVAAPVVLNFHGGSGNANEQLGMADMRALADADQFIPMPCPTRMMGVRPTGRWLLLEIFLLRSPIRTMTLVLSMH
jgi:hypothetical protein